jgi:hypothetical protein
MSASVSARRASPQWACKNRSDHCCKGGAQATSLYVLSDRSLLCSDCGGLEKGTSTTQQTWRVMTGSPRTSSSRSTSEAEAPRKKQRSTERGGSSGGGSDGGSGSDGGGGGGGGRPQPPAEVVHDADICFPLGAYNEVVAWLPAAFDQHGSMEAKLSNAIAVHGAALQHFAKDDAHSNYATCSKANTAMKTALVDWQAKQADEQAAARVKRQYLTKLRDEIDRVLQSEPAPGAASLSDTVSQHDGGFQAAKESFTQRDGIANLERQRERLPLLHNELAAALKAAFLRYPNCTVDKHDVNWASSSYKKGDEPRPRALTCGLGNRRDGPSPIGVLAYTKAPLLQVCIRLACEIIRLSHPGHYFTTVSFNSGRLDMHTDDKNYGDSLLLGVGDFTHGELWVHDDSGGQSASSRNLTLAGASWARFNARHFHFVQDYSGERFTASFFVSSWVDKVSSTDRADLEALGFRVPPAEAAELALWRAAAGLFPTGEGHEKRANQAGKALVRFNCQAQQPPPRPLAAPSPSSSSSSSSPSPPPSPSSSPSPSPSPPPPLAPPCALPAPLGVPGCGVGGAGAVKTEAPAPAPGAGAASACKLKRKRLADQPPVRAPLQPKQALQPPAPQPPLHQLEVSDATSAPAITVVSGDEEEGAAGVEEDGAGAEGAGAEHAEAEHAGAGVKAGVEREREEACRRLRDEGQQHQHQHQHHQHHQHHQQHHQQHQQHQQHHQ